MRSGPAAAGGPPAPDEAATGRKIVHRHGDHLSLRSPEERLRGLPGTVRGRRTRGTEGGLRHHPVREAAGLMSERRRFAPLVIGLAVAMALTVGLVPAGGDVPAGHVSENTRLDTGNDPLRGRDIPGMAVDPADPRHVVMIDEDFLAGQCDFHTSFDGGKTWTSGHLTVPSDFADPPCRTFDSGGYAHYNKSVVFGTGQNVYTTFASHRGEQQRPESNVVAGEGDSVIVNRSTDGGKTFQRGVVAIEGAKDSRPFIIRPGVAVQPRPQGDKLYVVGWYVINPPGMGASGGQGDRRAVVATSEDG